jgi:bifunctional DNA-binding transcriptional regulator/antitoxin component of YhaV-PrlF toxin-antitoxin module
MPTLTVTAKGQVTLKKEIFAHLKVQPGDKVTVNPLPNGRVEIQAEPARTKTFDDVFGMFPAPPGPPPTIEELNEIIADSWAGKR